MITKDSLQKMLDSDNKGYVMHVVGRALVALFERQTTEEQRTDDTKVDNSIGFAGCDARSGSLTAKSYLKYHALQDWQVEKWTKKGENGYSRLSKYWKQLNEVAEAKKAQS